MKWENIPTVNTTILLPISLPPVNSASTIKITYTAWDLNDSTNLLSRVAYFAVFGQAGVSLTIKEFDSPSPLNFTSGTGSTWTVDLVSSLNELNVRVGMSSSEEGRWNIRAEIHTVSIDPNNSLNTNNNTVSRLYPLDIVNETTSTVELWVTGWDVNNVSTQHHKIDTWLVAGLPGSLTLALYSKQHFTSGDGTLASQLVDDPRGFLAQVSSGNSLDVQWFVSAFPVTAGP